METSNSAVQSSRFKSHVIEEQCLDEKQNTD